MLELAGRLGALLGSGHEAYGFLADQAARADDTAPAERHPIDRVAQALDLSRTEVDLLLLAGLAEEHEGFAGILRELHPHRIPAPTAGLAAALAEAGALPGVPDDPVGARLWLRASLTDSPLVTTGAMSVTGNGPIWERTLGLADGLWDALHACSAWPPGVRQIDPELIGAVPPGLRAENAAVATALRAAFTDAPVTVLLDSADLPGAALRVAALFGAAGWRPAVLHAPTLDRVTARSVMLTALARGVIPVILVRELPDGPGTFDDVPVLAVLAAPAEATRGSTARPMLTLPVPEPTSAARRELWRRLAPDLPGAADAVPSTLSPAEALDLARDAVSSALLRGEPLGEADLRTALATRDAKRTPSGVVRLKPTAGWNDLVLPPERLAQLREAVARVRRQDQVLGRWGFLPGRQGRRGVRLLFCGPPGTGKTLAAEVLAREVGRDLYVVDLSRIVSKWIGETEKNLAEAFDAAERGDAVLLFDEADALFGRRTEVGDARDRYANLETAYLLSRLAWFDGIAVLATNLRQNIDQAFARRLEFVVPFDLPDRAERELLWRRHLPPAAPLADAAILDRLAAMYALSGALIRNAAVAAAFLAADEGTSIGPEHLTWAIRREYGKAGMAFPGPPPISYAAKESPCP